MQILSCIDRMDKAVPGVRAGYDSLSEIVHPNWAGVAGLYSKPDPPRYLTDFGRGLRETKGTVDMIANALLGSLGLFELAYPAVGEGDPLAKARFLLETTARGEMDLAEHMQALLCSTMWNG
ncbi:hypothetical protein ACFSOZ_16640 [Mesorhizobium newzealandense]|uniref:Uncharacterized protein n=1 Tax=Mesorhizobium newzealandense TaxID=1300302 RepID=A0ABW4UBJ7_9HYPH